MKPENGQKYIDALARGNRPVRIFLFGGIITAYIVMSLLGRLLGIDTDIDDEFDWPAIVLMIISLLSGFAASFSVVQYVETHKTKAEDD